ncbi:MAG: alpha/beta hydrolase, partial [Actinobacteria bacterium]|nr:alpha/beta hydrolase [Actinomycetota bacterium]
AHLYGLDLPMLFVEGTRDPFCPLATLEGVRSKISSCDLVVIDDGDHSFKVRKASGRTTEDAWIQITDEVFGWVTA